MPRSEPSANESAPQPPADLTRTLEQHIVSGFPPDLALDLVLNELVVRAADATHASAAALALVRGDQMVCRAATGLHAPDLGIPLNTRDGLSGACVRSRTTQLSTDTESDPRVDAAISRRLGIRSMLIVPVFDDEKPAACGEPPLAGVLEVFSTLPNAFSQSAQIVLEDLARECARIRRAASHPRARPPAEIIRPDVEPVPAGPEIVPPASFAEDSPPPIARLRQPYEAWTLVLGALVILAAGAVSFMIGSRIGWLRSPQLRSSGQASPPVSVASLPPAASTKSAAVAHNPAPPQTNPALPPPTRSANGAVSGSPRASSAGPSDDLVVYEKGKVVFRMKPLRMVTLAPEEAEGRLLNRVEPQYPAEALAAHRTGSVTLEVHVAEDGTVSSVRTLSGDPLLAAAAAQAVRNWRYQPYRPHNHASPFQTDVTLTFSLPN